MTETDLENALRAWIAAACAPSPVIWDRQRAPRPTDRPFATLRLAGPLPCAGVGAVPGWLQEFDPTDEAWAANQEIVESSRLDREYLIRVQTYGPTPAESRRIATQVSDSASLPSTRGRLDDSDIALIEVGSIQDVGALLDTDWEGRHMLEIRFRVVDLVSERTTTIQTVGITG